MREREKREDNAANEVRQSIVDSPLDGRKKKYYICQ
jgi:hypothetical protein